ncbi:MAG: inositol-3-phosphate synthase, partial [Candidatus Heimdallarchaeaceae archaeon]
MEKDEIRIALVGIGNVSSGIVQGIVYLKEYKDKNENLLHSKIGSYQAKNIRIVAALDVDVSKVGKDLSEAIFAPINSTPKFISVDSS